VGGGVLRGGSNGNNEKQRWWGVGKIPSCVQHPIPKARPTRETRTGNRRKPQKKTNQARNTEGPPGPKQNHKTALGAHHVVSGEKETRDQWAISPEPKLKGQTKNPREKKSFGNKFIESGVKGGVKSPWVTC